jgi:predicted secreted Zn-dependent protease
MAASAGHLMRGYSLSLVSPALLLACSLVQAEIHTWKDGTGKTHFSDRPAHGSMPIKPRDTTVVKIVTPFSRHENSADVKVSFTFYDAEPTSRQTLLATLLQASTITSNGRKFIGYTDWWLDWRYTTREQNGACGVATVKTQVKITYTMPRLTHSPVIPRDVHERFNAFYARLMAHEEGHADHGIFAAREIESALLTLPWQTSCAALLPMTRQAADSIIDKYKQKDKDYDRVTGHGKTQGAVL